MVQQSLEGVYVLSKMRLKYSKEDPVKYISHLDLLRTFNRAIKRAGLPIAYSQGFNPHPLISFGLPLSVGVTSETEYMDIELQTAVAPQVVIEQLNKVLPQGIKILAAMELGNKKDKLGSAIVWADYRVEVDLKIRLDINLAEHLENLLKSNELIINKEGKKGVKQVDILPQIHSLNIEEQKEKTVVFTMRLSAGSLSNLKPEMVLQAMEKYIEGFEVDFAKIHRVRLLNKDHRNIAKI
ncbi:MAG: hypothetical protein PWP27_790 [Clostridiales bacterium]|nr:hypothetical protein [Clostridiales bacterium]MDK2932980.1 hypothetical protein [Clostridiales bacterium]